MNFEIIQIPLIISLFSIASYSDFKTRSVNDGFWFSFGSVGLFLSFLSLDYNDVGSIIDFFLKLFLMMLTIFFIWILRFIGTADLFAFVTLSMITPKLLVETLFPIFVTLLSIFLAIICTIVINTYYNIKTVLSQRLFLDVEESTCRKILAFFLIHKKQKFETFCFQAVIQIDNKKKFRFFHDLNNEEFYNDSDYVSSSLPMIPFMLLSILVMFFLIGVEYLF
ncbi:MAG TPA: hypothetical protein VFM31_06540 [Nitrososphaeraceae archaeon]|nr:hypothetical protein [Nitrososphaeraceae archaeon]